MWKSLLIAPSLLLASACSTPPVNAPMPRPPANLAQLCDRLPKLPEPLADPDRLQWEADLVYSYAACAARHATTIRAWEDAVRAAEK